MNIQGLRTIRHMHKKRTDNRPAGMELVQIREKGAAFPKRRVAFELLLAVALSTGCWYTCFSMFPSPVDPLVCAFLITALPVGLYLLCWNPFFGRFLALCVFLLTAVVFLLAYRPVWNGLLVMGNIVVDVLNDEAGAGLVPFSVEGDTVDWTRDVFVTLIPLVLLTSMAIVHSIFYKAPLLAFLLTALPAAAGLCMKARPSVWLLALLIACWAGLLALCAVEKPENRKSKRLLYVQNRDKSSLPWLFLGASMLLILGYVLIFSGDSYRPPETVDQAREAAVGLGEHIRYDRLGGGQIDRLGEGDLNKTHPMAYTDNPVFTLRMPAVQPMYLRGFTGGSFERGRWREAGEGAYSGDYTGLIQGLAEKGFYPWMWQAQACRISGDKDFVSVSVKNVNGSSKYTYLPYEAVMTGGAAAGKVNYKKDFGAFSKGFFGQREYSFRAFLPKMTDYSEKAADGWLRSMKRSGGWKDYAKAEAAYRRFVYDTYLYVSDRDSDALGTSGIEKCRGKSAGYTLRYIRENFLREFDYDLRQEKAPGGQDELFWFMNKTRRGNDMHFATAAALMFRKAGIPARYAEGYYISPDYAARYKGEKNAALDVPDSLAHSWVEIYIDQMGWFPVEVIPGFFRLEKEEAAGQGETRTQKEKQDQPDKETAPAPSGPKQGGKQETPVSLWLLLPGTILLLAALYQLAGRYRAQKLLGSFGRVYTRQQVFTVYRYVSKVMAFDGHPLPADPYESLEEVSRIYDPAVGLSFADFLGLVSKVRFGGKSLTKEEHKFMARYALKAGTCIYRSQSRGKKILMKFILFYV